MALSEQQIAAIEAALANDPEYQRLLQENPRGGSGGSLFNRNSPLRQNVSARNQRLHELGIELPDDYGINSSGDVKRQSFADRHGGKIGLGLMAGIAGGAFLPALLGGGGAAGAGGGGAATGGGGGAAAATAATGAGGGGWNIAKRALGIGGDIAANALAGRTAGRQAEADYNMDRDRLALDRAAIERRGQLDAANLDLDQRQVGSKLDDSRLAQVIKLGLLGGLEDINIETPQELQGFVGKVAGGARPSAIAGRADVVAAMRPRIMEKILSGEKFDPINLAKLPELSETPRPGGVDKALEIGGWAGLASDLWNEFRPSSGASKPQPVYSNVVPPGVVKRSGASFI